MIRSISATRQSSLIARGGCEHIRHRLLQRSVANRVLEREQRRNNVRTMPFVSSETMSPSCRCCVAQHVIAGPEYPDRCAPGRMTPR